MSGIDFVQGVAQDVSGAPVPHKAVLYLQFEFVYSALFIYLIIKAC